MELPKQTPLYYANNISRYQRQDWIKLIEEQTGRRLIVYYELTELMKKYNIYEIKL